MRRTIRIAALLIIVASLCSCASTASKSNATGKITEISKYGNVKTDIAQSDFESQGFALGDLLEIRIGENVLTAPYGSGYANVNTGELIVLPSGGFVSAAINMGNFAKTYNAVNEMPISFKMKEKGGYLDEIEIRSVESKRTNKREDYASDEIFANFRPIVSGKIKPGRLYRSSNPVNPELGRNKYSDALIKKAGVKTVMNLADNEEELTSYPDYASSYYSTISVIPLNMTVDYRSGDFGQKLGRGLKFLSQHDTPWLVHCNEGKDRAGFASMILAALCGASVDELIADYMTTYENYYGVKKGSKQYDSISKSNIQKMIMDVSKTGTIEEARSCNLAEATANYLKEKAGITDTNIRIIRERLCN